MKIIFLTLFLLIMGCSQESAITGSIVKNSYFLNQEYIDVRPYCGNITCPIEKFYISDYSTVIPISNLYIFINNAIMNRSKIYIKYNDYWFFNKLSIIYYLY